MLSRSKSWIINIVLSQWIQFSCSKIQMKWDLLFFLDFSPQGLLMWTCGLLKSSLKSSSGWATSTAAWTPSSTPATTGSSSWPSSESSGASVTSGSAQASRPTTTAPPTSAPLDTRAKAQQTTTPAAWTAASAPCPPLPAPAPAPATWAGVSHPALKGKCSTSGAPPPHHLPHPKCCLAAPVAASRELWGETWGELKHLRWEEGSSASPLQKTGTSGGQTRTVLPLTTTCDSFWPVWRIKKGVHAVS